MKKLNGSFHFLRKYLELDTTLSDQEYRLLMVYRGICDWDSKHENFGSSEISLRNIKEQFLTHWSIGKLSEIRRQLIIKGVLREISRTRIGIKNPEIFYQKRVRDILDAVQRSERNVRYSEQSVQISERRKQLSGTLSMVNYSQNVRPIERRPGTKEP